MRFLNLSAIGLMRLWQLRTPRADRPRGHVSQGVHRGSVLSVPIVAESLKAKMAEMAAAKTANDTKKVQELDGGGTLARRRRTSNWRARRPSPTSSRPWRRLSEIARRRAWL